MLMEQLGEGMPYAYAVKNPQTGRQLAWQNMIPAENITCRSSGTLARALR